MTNTGTHTKFSRWLSEHWQRPGETKWHARQRIVQATRLSKNTVGRALRGAPMRASTAHLLAALTEDRVPAGHLALGELHLHATAETTNASQP